jgi:2-polyprenyl-3-methyl-5-hydroxy-6-metoxy-1,4-benzoquinol methylase
MDLTAVRGVLARRIRGVQRRRLISANGAPASYYDHAYDGSTAEYTNDWSLSRYLPVWEAVCDRIAPGSEVLEIGCGPGQLARMLLDRAIPGGYVGFDFSPAAIELAKRNLPGGRVEVAEPRTTTLFSTASYQVVVCTEVLEHIVDDLAVLDRIPPGTQVLATVPNFDYDSHVRFFRSIQQVRERYSGHFTSLEISEHCHAGDAVGARGIFYLLNGIR